jgi:transcriptional regulator with XRE-family HTH domain
MSASTVSLFARELGARFRSLGATPAAIAAVAGVTEAAVLRWQCGRGREPTRAQVEAVADAFGVRPGWLAFGDGPIDAPRPPLAAVPGGATAQPARSTATLRLER